VGNKAQSLRKGGAREDCRQGTDAIRLRKDPEKFLGMSRTIGFVEEDLLNGGKGVKIQRVSTKEKEDDVHE